MSKRLPQFRPGRRDWLAIAVWILLVARLAAQIESPTVADLTLKSDTQRPIPRDGIPVELKELIEAGKVEVVYDSDPEFVKESRGWADFHIQIRTAFKYDVKKTRKDNRWHVKLIITKLEPTIELTHLIRLPSTFKSADIWNSRLLRHEFDHVAVSLDPRAMQLLEHLLKQIRVIEQILEPNETPSNEVFNRLIDEEVAKRRRAVVELLQKNNRQLDKLGAHGVRVVPNRADFFSQLYTKQNLAETDFPFIEQVSGLLKTPKYQAAETHLRFLPRDPAQK